LDLSGDMFNVQLRKSEWRVETDKAFKAQHVFNSYRRAGSYPSLLISPSLTHLSSSKRCRTPLAAKSGAGSNQICPPTRTKASTSGNDCAPYDQPQSIPFCLNPKCGATRDRKLSCPLQGDRNGCEDSASVQKAIRCRSGEGDKQSG